MKKTYVPYSNLLDFIRSQDLNKRIYCKIVKGIYYVGTEEVAQRC